MAVSPAKRPASAVYLLFVLVDVASAACPGGWTLWDDGGKCYKVTAGRFNALGCATACGENASLACISSSSEAEFVASLTRSVGDVWIGLYQSPGGAEPGGGWNRCASGEATNFTNWLPGYPDDFSGNYDIGQQCAAKGRAYLGNRWFDHACYHPFQCLCELGAPASAEYLSFIEADIEEGQQRLSATAGFLYGMIVMCWLWPPAFLFTLLACFRLRRSLRRPKVIDESPVLAASASSAAPEKATAEKAKKAEKSKKAELTELAKQNTEAIKLTEAERADMVDLQQKLAPMSPRRQLLRLWLAFRLLCLAVAPVTLGIFINTLLCDPFVDPLGARPAFTFGVISASCFTTALVLSLIHI